MSYTPIILTKGFACLKIAKFLCRRLTAHGWIKPSSGDGFQGGVVLSTDEEDVFVSEPENCYPELVPFCRKLDIAALCTMQGDVVNDLLQRLHPDTAEVVLAADQVIPILPSRRDLINSDSSVRRRDFACFIKDEKLLLAWSTNANALAPHMSHLETKMMDAVRYIKTFDWTCPPRPISKV